MRILRESGKRRNAARPPINERALRESSGRSSPEDIHLRQGSGGRVER